jgi:hypothetical protein
MTGKEGRMPAKKVKAKAKRKPAKKLLPFSPPCLGPKKTPKKKK